MIEREGMLASMKCFKSFFKHTWHPQQMEGPAFQSTKSESHRAGDTELEELKVIVPTSTVATSTPVQPGNIPCQNGGCKSSRSRGEPRPESPWHLLKTIFLVSVIVALIVWIIVYTLLAQYRVL